MGQVTLTENAMDVGDAVQVGNQEHDWDGWLTLKTSLDGSPTLDMSASIDEASNGAGDGGGKVDHA